MANWAQNWVEFSGENTKIKEVKDLFKAMELQCDLTHEGQIPPFIKKPKQDYFFDIYADESETVFYQTKYSSNIEDLIEIANHFDLNFIVTYQETSNNLFGKAIFTAGNSEAQVYNLENSDFDLFSTNESSGFCEFEGNDYEIEEELLQIIFEKKFNQDY